MNLAWNELNENILHEKIQLKTTNRDALDMVKKFNNSSFSKNDLDEASYYIKSWPGQETVDLINKESKAKFPTKSFGDLDIQLEPKDFISYAYFLKQVEYKIAFDTTTFPFEWQAIQGFYANGQAQKNNIQILSYTNDNKFIISLQLKDSADQLILAKGYDMNTPNEVIDVINTNKGTVPMENNDLFQAPILHLDHHRDYTELLQWLTNPWWEEYKITKMFENIKFDMDEKWARVENEAVIGMGFAGAWWPPPKHKTFILNKSYRVVMKRTGAQNPYFVFWVKNTNVMKLAN